MVSRGITVTCETIRQWTLKFGQGMRRNFAVTNRSAGTNGIRRGGTEHQGQVLLPVARGRSGRPSARYADARPAQPARGKPLFPQATQGLALRSTGAGHRQAEELRRSEKAHLARCRTSPAQGAEQPGRTLTPTDAATGTTDAPLQVTWPSAALSVGTRSDQQCFPVSAQPPIRWAVPARAHMR